MTIGYGRKLRYCLLILLCSQLSFLLAQQPGFVSIDCGATSPYTDDLGIEWTTDENYTFSGRNGEAKTVITAVTNVQQFSTLRYFPEKRRKHCYSLPAVEGSVHLLRACFLHGGFEPVVNNDFSLSIDSTIIDKGVWTDAEIDLAGAAEYTFRASAEHVSVCLIPNVGTPFINSIELRPLSRGMYDGDNLEGKVLKGLYRANFGADASQPPLRYPDDPYDRLWIAPIEQPESNVLSTTKDVDVAGLQIKPPARVFQTAWSAPFFWLTFPIGAYDWNISKSAFISLYVADIVDDGFNPTLNVTVNGELFIDNFTATPAYSAYQLYSLNPNYIFSNSTLNVTFYAEPGSQADPIINAAEVYSVKTAAATRTDAGDFEALEAIKEGFGLTSWIGDPCLPVPYDWITCSKGNVLQVTQINLSSSNVTGTISPRIASLALLTELRLDDNHIYGPIPDMEGLGSLTILHLQKNSLSGGIPASLASLPALTELDVSDNDLSGPIPAALASKDGLTLRTEGNENLCAPTENCVVLDPDLSPPNQNGGGDGGGGGGSSAAIIGAVVGGIIFLAAILGLTLWWYCRGRTPKTDPSPITGPSMQPKVGGAAVAKHARGFTFAEVQAATSRFQTVIGEGGYGPVYYGKLPDGTELAVKVNSASSGQGHKEFLNEVALLSRVHHRNLVGLLGFCEENNQQILIYEYMPQGTLREHLYGQNMKGRLSWKQRLEVALNAAKGLEYLHNDITPRIIHRDVKSTNILLDGKLEAKVADFGVSKIALEGQTAGVMTVVLGTTGYLDPEYYRYQVLTQKSDVYSFGVVLLEILCGKPPTTPEPSGNGVITLVDWADAHLKSADVETIVDPAIRGTCNTQSLWKMAELALECVQPQGAKRPDISQVIRELSTALEYETQGSLSGVKQYETQSSNGVFDSSASYTNPFHIDGSAPSTMTSIPDFPATTGV